MKNDRTNTMRDSLQIRDEKIAKITDELKWAWDNMTFTSYPPDDEAEYEFCNVCNQPEWKHKANCEAVKHKKSAQALLGK